MTDIKRILRNGGIPFSTEGKTATQGWININCPFCGDRKLHGGFNLSKGYYHCWVCGFHPMEKVLMNLFSVKYSEAKEIIKSNQTETIQRKRIESSIQKSEFKMPGSLPLNERHLSYLKDRGFDPDILQKKYQLKGTDHLNLSYNNRIIIPIIFQGETVSFTSRDITGLAEMRYKSCPSDMEIIPHKNLLYNLDNCREEYILIVEGIVDVWKMGDNSAATFGISFTSAQVNILNSRYKKFFILFDAEPEAQKQAERLADHLVNLDKEVVILNLEGWKDPGDLPIKEAQNIMGNLLSYEN